MNRIVYYTSDVFEYPNMVERKEWFNHCYEIALKCGLTCLKVAKKNGELELDIHGTKPALVKYYLMTFEHPGCIAHLKRIMQIITM